MHKIFFYNKFIIRLYMFRRSKLYYTASGIITPVGGRSVHRLREEVFSQPVHRTATYRCDDTRRCIIPPDVLETCRGV